VHREPAAVGFNASYSREGGEQRDRGKLTPSPAGTSPTSGSTTTARRWRTAG